MTKKVPIHRIKRNGIYTITSYLNLDELHVKINVGGRKDFIHSFKLDQEEDFHRCFEDLALLAEIKTTLKKY